MKMKPVNAAEFKEDICPICGGKLNFGGDHRIDDNGEGTSVSWTCSACGAKGRECYSMEFSEHLDVYAAIGRKVPLSQQDTPGEGGFCPVCHGRLKYEDHEIEETFGTSTRAKWECQNCHATGVEWNDLVFSEHTGISNADGADIPVLSVVDIEKLTDHLRNSIGCGHRNKDGDLVSEYFPIVMSSAGAKASVCAVEERSDGVKPYYTIHVVDDVNQKDCYMVFTASLERDELRDVLKTESGIILKEAVETE